MNPRTINGVTCTACGCVCDDLSVTIDDNRIASVKRGCAKADAWFANQTNTVLTKESPLADAVQRAAAILETAKNPLIFGLTRTTIAGQREAIALAEQIGATIDPGVSNATLAMRQTGQSAVSLGDLRDRADFVLIWNCDPTTTHPRFLERFINAPGRFTPNGRADRFVIVAGNRETETNRSASVALPLNDEWATLWNLRLHVLGKPHRLDPVWAELAERMKTCRYGVILFDPKTCARVLEALFQLVAELNSFTRFSTIAFNDDVSGVSETLTWQTGYPFAVRFIDGAPSHDADAFTADAMLARGQADAAVLLGSEAISQLSTKAMEHLKSIPVIRLDAVSRRCELVCAVTFTTATFGLNAPGLAQRMDGLALPLTVLTPGDFPQDFEVLKAIRVELA